MLPVVFFLLTFSFAKAQSPDNYNAKGWENARAYLSEYADTKIEPCSNFAGFVCANFGNASNPDYYEWLPYEMAKLRIETLKRAISGIGQNGTNAPKYARFVRSYYDQCVNAKNDISTMKTVLDLVSTQLGTYPPFEQPRDPKTGSNLTGDVWYLVGKLQNGLGHNFAFNPEFEIMAANGKRSGFLRLDPAAESRFADVATFLDLNELRNTTLQLATVSGIKPDLALLDKILSETQAFMDDWRNASLVPPGIPMGTTVANASDVIPSITWSAFWQGLLTEQAADIWLKGENIVVVVSSDVARAVAAVFNRHPVRAIKTAMFGYLFGRTNAQVTGLNTVTTTYIFRPTSREEECIEYLVQQVVPATVRVYFDQVGEDPIRWRNEFLFIAQSVYSAMRLLLNSIDYMTPATKERVNKKMDAIRLNPGIPLWIMDEKQLLANSGNYSESRPFAVNTILRARDLFLSGQQKLSDPERAEDEPPPTFTINSNYKPWDGNFHINVFLGWNLPPYFSQFYPLAVKFGGTGFLVGHELMHAFDPDNVKQAAVGTDPMMQKDEATFYAVHEECILRQYSSACYKKIGACQVGSVAMGDNIADVGGLKAAYAAYQFVKGVLGEEPPVPGFTNHTGDQLFYMAFQRQFCSRNEPSDLASGHSPSPTRARVALINNPHFAEAFQCPVGSAAAPMNPCKMWGDILSSGE